MLTGLNRFIVTVETAKDRPFFLEHAGILAELAAPADEVQIAKHFTAANKDRIAELLETLSSLRDSFRFSELTSVG